MTCSEDLKQKKEEEKLRKDHPEFIQTTNGFIFKIERYEQGVFIINQGQFVSYYDISQEIFYGTEDHKLIKRDLKPKHPEVYRDWFNKLS